MAGARSLLRAWLKDSAASRPVSQRPRAAIEVLEDRRLLSATLSAVAAGQTTSPPAIVVSTARSYGVTLDLRAGQAFKGYVGTLAGVQFNTKQDTVNASINWGDGSAPTQGTVTISTAGRINVSGGHTYTADGKYAITITVTESPTPIPGKPTPLWVKLLGTINSKAVVTANSTGGVTIHETAGKKFTATVGTFQFPAPGNGLAATIDWGDGTTSKGTLVPAGIIGIDVIKYDVNGTHTYAEPGKYPITVIVTRSFGPPGSLAPIQLITTIDSTADVSPAASLSLTGSIAGTYKLAPVNPDIGAVYVFTGTGAAGAMGPVAANGSVHLPGFIATGKATGTLTLNSISTTPVNGGSVTLSLTGPTEAGFGPFPKTLKYVITGGTGAFDDATGSGVIDVTLGTAAQTFIFKIVSN